MLCKRHDVFITHAEIFFLIPGQGHGPTDADIVKRGGLGVKGKYSRSAPDQGIGYEILIFLQFFHMRRSVGDDQISLPGSQCGIARLMIRYGPEYEFVQIGFALLPVVGIFRDRDVAPSLPFFEHKGTCSHRVEVVCIVGHRSWRWYQRGKSTGHGQKTGKWGPAVFQMKGHLEFPRLLNRLDGPK